MKTPGILNFQKLATVIPMLGLASCSAHAVNHTDVKGTHPNILFILADDMGYNDPSYMGSDYFETPNIDRLAKEGLAFTNAYASAANSAPSRSCLMTGMLTPRHKVYTVAPSARGKAQNRKLIPIKTSTIVAPRFVSIAEALVQQGYQSAHFGKWHMGSDQEGEDTGPLSQGFIHNTGGAHEGHPYSYFYPYCSKSKCHVGIEGGKEGEYLTDRLTDEAIKFMHEKGHEKPFFMYMAHYAVHTPLKAPKPLIDKYKAKTPGKYHKNPVYAAMVENLDTNVGRLLQALEEEKLADNTIVIFFSDNGGSEPVTDNFELRGGKGTPYEGGTREPLIIKYPGHIQAGTVTDVPVTGVDFYPTLVNLAGGTPAADLDGQDIFEVIKENKDRDLFWHFPAYLQSKSGMPGGPWRATPYSSIRRGDWKLISFYEDNHVELYNLKNDPKEAKECSKQHPEVTKQLQKKLSTWLKETQADIPTEENPKYDPNYKTKAKTKAAKKNKNKKNKK